MDRIGTGKPTDITGHRLRHSIRRADLRAVAETRRRLREHLRRWGVPALTDTAELLATELVTNALQHTGGGAVVTATLSPGPAHRLRVEVRDSAGRYALGRYVRRHGRPAEPDEDERVEHEQVEDERVEPPDEAGEYATSGRGLLLVQALADAWGVHARGGGKVVWFELLVHTA
ncbi:ATP-binding protein [Streptomyces sp. CA-111067]|uniref:ATP-binding protein n=1 Tax=Streptomyces sp. CA-111067 TaxID=3240046 RepID=UPI003D98BAC6